MKTIYEVYSGDLYDVISYGKFKNKNNAEELIRIFQKEDKLLNDNEEYWISEKNVFDNMDEWNEYISLSKIKGGENNV